MVWVGLARACGEEVVGGEVERGKGGVIGKHGVLIKTERVLFHHLCYQQANRRKRIQVFALN